jgi:hypothetical protein
MRSDADGEVESFELVPVYEVAEVIRTSQRYKPNCALVVIDFYSVMGELFFSLTSYQMNWLPLCQVVGTLKVSESGRFSSRFIHPDQPGYLHRLRSLHFSGGSCIGSGQNQCLPWFWLSAKTSSFYTFEILHIQLLKSRFGSSAGGSVP